MLTLSKVEWTPPTMSLLLQLRPHTPVFREMWNVLTTPSMRKLLTPLSIFEVVIYSAGWPLFFALTSNRGIYLYISWTTVFLSLWILDYSVVCFLCLTQVCFSLIVYIMTMGEKTNLSFLLLRETGGDKMGRVACINELRHETSGKSN